jgi:hypothetical protein
MMAITTSNSIKVNADLADFCGNIMSMVYNLIKLRLVV